MRQDDQLVKFEGRALLSLIAWALFVPPYPTDAISVLWPTSELLPAISQIVKLSSCLIASSGNYLFAFVH